MLICSCVDRLFMGRLAWCVAWFLCFFEVFITEQSSAKQVECANLIVD